MIKYVAFDTEIDIFWDKIFGLSEKLEYEIFLDGKALKRTEKTLSFQKNKNNAN